MHHPASTAAAALAECFCSAAERRGMLLQMGRQWQRVLSGFEFCHDLSASLSATGSSTDTVIFCAILSG